MSNVELLRRIGKTFIWLGALACGVHLLLTLPGVRSISGFLLLIADTISRLAMTVGLGAVLLALTEATESLRSMSGRPENKESTFR